MRGRTSGGWALEVFENEEAGLKKNHGRYCKLCTLQVLKFSESDSGAFFVFCILNKFQ
jgi:hypothetical protein